jgi:hypothetical protein
MGAQGLSDAELLKRVAALWLRHRAQPMVNSHLPQHLREALDETVRRTNLDHAPRSTNDTPTETPASRRR